MIGTGHVFHVNVNCTDLDRSLAFYRDVLGLDALTRTTPERPQPGAAFGLDEVQWDAHILGGSSGYGGAVVDLLQWQVPPPTGRPAAVDERGFVSLLLERPDPGVPTDATDPDGTVLRVQPGDATRFAGVVIGSGDPARSRSFYTGHLGFSVADDGSLIDGRGFRIELVPTAPGVAASTRAANTVGIYRMAFLTDDIDTDVAALTDARVELLSPPAALDMGPGIPPLRAAFFPDPDGAMLELIESGTGG